MIASANHGETVGMLCDAPPEGRETFDWVQPGKEVRVPGLKNIVSKSDLELNVTKTAKLCRDHHICQYLLYDSGWYGNEDNVTSDPMKPVDGFDLDVVSQIATDHGLKTVMYINELALSSPERVEELAKYLVKAGVGGVKMGFMHVTSTQKMRNVIEYLRIFGRHKLVVNIHDNFCGFGIQRTFPQLLSVEGVAGDEHNDKDYSQRDLILPFTRSEAGRMDHTFLIDETDLARLKLTPLAQVAKSVILGVNGLWTIYWYAGWPLVQRFALDKSSPYSLWNEMDNRWTASVFLDSVPGDYVSLARQIPAGSWYIVALVRGSHSFSWQVADFVGKGKGKFKVQRWTEAGVSDDEELVDAQSTLHCTVEDHAVTGMHSGCILRLTPAV
jgi:alpha-glucosidase